MFILDYKVQLDINQSIVHWNIIMVCGECDIIAHYFNLQQQNRHDVNIGISDDCVLIKISERQQLAITTEDTLEDLSYKSLAVNLSDLAAMGKHILHGFFWR